MRYIWAPSATFLFLPSWRLFGVKQGREARCSPRPSSHCGRAKSKFFLNESNQNVYMGGFLPWLPSLTLLLLLWLPVTSGVLPPGCTPSRLTGSSPGAGAVSTAVSPTASFVLGPRRGARYLPSRVPTLAILLLNSCGTGLRAAPSGTRGSCFRFGGSVRFLPWHR